MSVAARIAIFQLLVLGGKAGPVVIVEGDAPTNIAEFARPAVADFRPSSTVVGLSRPVVGNFRSVALVANFTRPTL